MLFLMVFLIFTKTTYSKNLNGGSAIFYNRQCRSECWNEDDIAKLRGRKAFEQLILPRVRPDKINNAYMKNALRYYRRAIHVLEKNSDPHTARLLKEAFLDAVGAHFRREFLPTVHLAYYAGYVSHRNARQVEDFFEEVKADLNTQGIGWKRPRGLPEWSNLTVSKIQIGVRTIFDPCSNLLMKRDSKKCIHLPIPKLDDESNPSAVALPFKVGGLVSLTAPSAENAVLKYYTTASRCILRSSPENCRHSDFVNFNNEIWHWMKRDIASHLLDEKLYTAYGGVLRIAAAVQSYGKVMPRRNLFENQNYVLTKWHPWNALTQPHVYITTDWTPKIYVIAVLLIALVIYLVQICLNYVFSRTSGCNCAETPKEPECRNQAYTVVESNIPAVLPQQSADYYCETKRVKRTNSKIKTTSLGSLQTQKVYDLNENTEKLMTVIISDKETSSPQSNGGSEHSYIPKKSLESPPKLDASVAQLKIDRTPRGGQVSKMYLSSTLSRSDVTYCQKLDGSESSLESQNSTSDRSISSTTSKTQTKRSKSSRDLAWARRVFLKHSARSLQSTSVTELDTNSFTTPPSKR